MFEYAAAGLPILSTGFGARGTGFKPDIHCYEATTESFADRIAELARHDRATLAEFGAAAKRYVQETSDWRVIGRRYRALAAELIGGR
jgi:glycosyltransferase involved in cell wall biosynthesis